jgi:hypothetical protein
LTSMLGSSIFLVIGSPRCERHYTVCRHVWAIKRNPEIPMESLFLVLARAGACIYIFRRDRGGRQAPYPGLNIEGRASMRGQRARISRSKENCSDRSHEGAAISHRKRTKGGMWIARCDFGAGRCRRLTRPRWAKHGGCDGWAPPSSSRLKPARKARPSGPRGKGRRKSLPLPIPLH